MPFVKVNIHFVWATKNRMPFLATREIRKMVWQHMRENAKKKGIYIKNQEEHHSHKSYQEEYREFIRKYGFQEFG